MRSTLLPLTRGCHFVIRIFVVLGRVYVNAVRFLLWCLQGMNQPRSGQVILSLPFGIRSGKDLAVVMVICGRVGRALVLVDEGEQVATCSMNCCCRRPMVKLQ